MKLGAIDFDDRILDALRDDKLVVFAGAGVSMGPPSNLPNFKGPRREDRPRLRLGTREAFRSISGNARDERRQRP